MLEALCVQLETRLSPFPLRKGAPPGASKHRRDKQPTVIPTEVAARLLLRPAPRDAPPRSGGIPQPVFPARAQSEEWAFKGQKALSSTAPLAARTYSACTKRNSNGRPHVTENPEVRARPFGLFRRAAPKLFIPNSPSARLPPGGLAGCGNKRQPLNPRRSNCTLRTKGIRRTERVDFFGQTRFEIESPRVT